MFTVNGTAYNACLYKVAVEFTIFRLFCNKLYVILLPIAGDCKIVCVRMNDSLNLFL